MAKQLIGKAPLTQARTTAGRVVFIGRGRPAPSDLSSEDRKRLLAEGYLEEIDADTEPEPQGDGAPTSVKDILKEVGDDKAKAQEFLDAEKAKGDDARSSLVEKLEAIVGATA